MSVIVDKTKSRVIKATDEQAQKYAFEIKRDIKEYILNDFWDKHLSGQLMYKGMKETANSLIITPRKYDTAHFIKTQRRKKGIGDIRYRQGSYADELNKKGSEFEVFKKKKDLSPRIKKRKIANISEKNLDRVVVRPHNHKGYLTKAIKTSIDNFQKYHKKDVERVNVWLVD